MYQELFACTLCYIHLNGSYTVYLPRARMRKRGKVIILYVCQHENHHFGKSRDLSDSLVSLFSQSVQKLPLVLFKLLSKARTRHEQHLLLPYCTLFYLKQKFFCTIVNIATLVLQQSISEDICL